jgi:hypothetical protein
MAAMALSSSLSWLLVIGLLLHASAQVVINQAATPTLVTGATASAALTALPGTGACPEIATLAPGTVVELSDYSIERQMSILAPGGNASLGSISSPVYSYALENDLRTTTGSLVAKLVSPVVFWDTTADFYDCVNDQFAQIQWSTTNWWTNIWNPYARIYEIYDASGNQVATMEKVQVQSHVAGTGIIALKVTISAMQTTVAIPLLLQDPRFLSLIAAAELAPGNLGPFWTVLFWALPWACMICCCCTLCCGPSAKSGPARQAELINAEERSRLIGPGESGAKEAAHQAQYAPAQKQGAQGWFNCCSRRQVAPGPGGMPPV